jgi:hypothetical protein
MAVITEQNEQFKTLALNRKGRSILCRTVLKYLFYSPDINMRIRQFPQIKYLIRILPWTSDIIPDCTDKLAHIPVIEESLISQMETMDSDELYSTLVTLSKYKFSMDIPFNVIQKQKTILKNKKSLTIKDCLILKLLGKWTTFVY